MAQRIVEIPYAPRRAFKPFHTSDARWRVIVAHRRAGKTVACVNEMIRAALSSDRPNFRGGYVSPFYRQSKAVAWDYFKFYSKPVPGVSVNESELRIDYPNGARIQLFGADNADALRGLFFDLVVADEFGDWKPSVFPMVIRPALADRQGKAIIIGTPKGRNDFYRVWEQANTTPGWFALEVNAATSGILPESELADARRSMTEDQYAQEFECSFDAAILGAYYGREMRVAMEEGRITSVGWDAALKVYTAWDLGYTDDTAIWWYQVHRGEVRVLEYYAASGEAIKHYADIVSSKPYQYHLHWLPHDAKAKTLASGGKSIEEMLRGSLKGQVVIVPDLSVQDGIQAARKMMERTWFDADKCAPGLEALRQYQREYDEDKKAFKLTPRHDWTSHGADAFRMLAVACREMVPDKPKPPPKFWHEQSLDELWRDNRQGKGRI